MKQIVGDMPVYLTFDIDCLDPGYAGLTSDLNWYAANTVTWTPQVAPAYDQSEITALAAATLALEMLYIQAAKKGE